MTFPYSSYNVAPTPTNLDGTLHRPEVPITIGGPAGTLRLSALLDTGADETILPRSLGEELGIAVDDEAQSHAVGFDGNAIGVAYGRAQFCLTDDQTTVLWSAIVGFVSFSRPETECLVLGHAGFLEHFRVCFDGDQRVATLEPTGASVLAGMQMNAA